MRHSLWAICAIWLLLTMVASCHDRTVYDHYIHTSLAGWDKGDTLTFLLPEIGEEGMYGMDLNLRTNGQYPFMGITLIVEKTFYPSLFRLTDTIHCKLVEKNGTPRNQGVSFYQNTYHVADLHLQRGDSMQVEVRHDMKRETLPGIGDVGIVLKRY